MTISPLIPSATGLPSVSTRRAMVSQTRYVLDKYKANGGAYTEAVIPGAHGCQLESPDAFVAAIR